MDSKLWRQITNLKLVSSVGIRELGTHEESEVEPNPEEIEDDLQIERQFEEELQQERGRYVQLRKNSVWYFDGADDERYAGVELLGRAPGGCRREVGVLSGLLAAGLASSTRRRRERILRERDLLDAALGLALRDDGLVLWRRLLVGLLPQP